METEEFVSLREIADQLGLERSNARKYILKLGYAFHRRRTADSRNQPALCLTPAEAEEIIARRRAQGYLEPIVISAPSVGTFYVIQLVPDLDQRRVKLGFAESLERRITEYRTVSPTAQVVHSWPCRREWEPAVITALTRAADCKRKSTEVFDCENLEALVKRGNDIFNMLMPIDSEPQLTSSPLPEG